MSVEQSVSGAPAWRVLISPAHRFFTDLRQLGGRRRQLLQAHRRATTVAAVEQELAGFSESAEGVFLKTGERLLDLQLRSREIAAQTTSVAELLMNDGGESLAVLDNILESAGEERQDHATVESARTVQENSLSIQRAIESFDRLVNTFDVLGMMTRIESARLEAAGETFDNLAETVMTLSRQVREHIDTTANSAKALLSTTAQAEQEMRRVAHIRRENIGPLARQASVSIQSIRDRRSRVAHANTQLAEHFGRVSLAIGDLVEAMQAHDIVRQQIEHVMEALQRIEAPDESEGRRLATIRLQAAQLDHSRITFCQSVQRIREALARIDQNIQEIAGSSAALLESPEATNEAAFVSGLEANLAGILKILESNERADRMLAGAAASIDERVREISRTIAGVQTIGIAMHRIGLNATIQAARLGHGGAALEIVASSVQALATEAGTASSTISERLSGIRDAAGVLEKAAIHSESAPQIPQLSQSAAGLNSIQDQARSGYARTSGKITELTQRVGETISAFGDQSASVERLETATRLLRELLADSGTASASDVEQIAATYTMQSERDIHRSLFEPTGAQNRESELPGAGPVTPERQEDNVEFF